MSNNPFSIRTISQGAEAKTTRTLVFDENFKLRPLLKGESIGDYAGERLFQEVFAGDYLVTTILDEGSKIPHLRVTRHREKAIGGPFAVEVLNRISPICARYLMDFSI